MANPLIQFSRERFTEAQRRRAESLVLVTHLFPSASPGATQAQIATWIATGRWEMS